MIRAEVLAAIVDFAGPLGPFEEPDARALREDAWAMAANEGLIQRFFGLLVAPPTHHELRGVAPDVFGFELSVILSKIGSVAPSAVLAKLAPLLDDANARPTVIEVIGSLGVEEALVWLALLVERPNVSDEEGVRLACALGEIGGPTAQTLLDTLEKATAPTQGAVLLEIEIARADSERPR